MVLLTADMGQMSRVCDGFIDCSDFERICSFWLVVPKELSLLYAILVHSWSCIGQVAPLVANGSTNNDI